MQLYKIALGVLCVFLACGTTKETIIIEKESTQVREKSISETEYKSTEVIDWKTVDLGTIHQEKEKVRAKSLNIPRNIRLRFRIENGVIKSNFIMTPKEGNLYFDHLKRHSDFTRLFFYSNVYKQMWQFDVPHRNGEFDIIGTIKN